MFTNENVQIKDNLLVKNNASEIAEIQEALSIESSAPEISEPDEILNKNVKNQSELSVENCMSEMSMANEFTNETQLDQNELSTMSMSKGGTDDLAQKQCEHLQNSDGMSTKDSMSIIIGENMESQGESAIRDSLSTDNNAVMQYSECTRELAATNSKRSQYHRLRKTSKYQKPVCSLTKTYKSGMNFQLKRVCLKSPKSRRHCQRECHT